MTTEYDAKVGGMVTWILTTANLDERWGGCTLEEAIDKAWSKAGESGLDEQEMLEAEEEARESYAMYCSK